jgi:uncharacterized protein YraI
MGVVEGVLEGEKTMFGKKLLTLMLTGCMLLALVVPALAQDTTPDPASQPVDTTPQPAAQPPLVAATDLFVISQFRVNVRSGPSTDYTILGRLTPADSLDITGQNANADWLRVNFNGQEGWVFLDVVTVNGAIENAPVAEAGPTAVLRGGATQTGAAASGDVVVTTRFNTNLRSTFSTDADILEVIPFNTELLPEGRTDNGNWVMVNFGEQSGWVFAPILFFTSGQIETLPVLATSTDEAVTTQSQAQATAEPTTSP